ncbi:hypothetical protein A2291_05735 [candidate division WOR-1 bacterium RIFOXYB2_FULL_42_35]|nr:MAG: hypothetical protein A2291_05735 [candidate division WOR-1 bacterium RIFOXYB2_FULL_42_35]
MVCLRTDLPLKIAYAFIPERISNQLARARSSYFRAVNDYCRTNDPALREEGVVKHDVIRWLPKEALNWRTDDFGREFGRYDNFAFLLAAWVKHNVADETNKQTVFVPLFQRWEGEGPPFKADRIVAPVGNDYCPGIDYCRYGCYSFRLIFSGDQQSSHCFTGQSGASNFAWA